MTTGESRPVTRSQGDRIVAGTVVTDSRLRVHVAATGDDTTLAGIQKTVADAQSSRSRAQRLADRAPALLFYVALPAAPPPQSCGRHAVGPPLTGLHLRPASPASVYGIRVGGTVVTPGGYPRSIR